MNQFRAKRVDNNQWVFGDRVQGASGKMYIFDYDDINHTDLGIYEVIPETVGQFTGRKDIDGVDIYNGDIVLHGESKRFVEWRWTNFVLTTMDISGTILLSFSESPKVIGNIHEIEVSNG